MPAFWRYKEIKYSDFVKKNRLALYNIVKYILEKAFLAWNLLTPKEQEKIIYDQLETYQLGSLPLHGRKTPFVVKFKKHYDDDNFLYAFVYDVASHLRQILELHHVLKEEYLGTKPLIKEIELSIIPYTDPPEHEGLLRFIENPKEWIPATKSKYSDHYKLPGSSKKRIIIGGGPIYMASKFYKRGFGTRKKPLGFEMVTEPWAFNHQHKSLFNPKINTFFAPRRADATWLRQKKKENSDRLFTMLGNSYSKWGGTDFRFMKNMNKLIGHFVHPVDYNRTTLKKQINDIITPSFVQMYIPEYTTSQDLKTVVQILKDCFYFILLGKTTPYLEEIQPTLDNLSAKYSYSDIIDPEGLAQKIRSQAKYLLIKLFERE